MGLSTGMVSTSIAFNTPHIPDTAFSAVHSVLKSGSLSGNGPIGKAVESNLSKLFGNASVLLTPSCSAALDLAARTIDLGPGDEVIVPSFTFPTSVSSVVALGARPIYADISIETLGLDPRSVGQLISPRTKAIFLTHYAGIGAHPDVVAELARIHEIRLIEDNAHGIFAQAGGKQLGTFGELATLSFHETKNLTCGEGGALIVNDPELLDRASIIREKGTNRQQFLRGEIDRYTWKDAGSNFLLSEVSAAVLASQLDRADEIQGSRRKIWNEYYMGLKDWATRRGVLLPSQSALLPAHIFFLIFGDAIVRSRFIEHMKAAGIQVVTHYEPLHRSQFGSKFLEDRQELKVTEQVAAGLVRLPLHLGLRSDEVDRVIERVLSFSV